MVINRTTGGATVISAIESDITSIDNTNYAGRMKLKTAQAGSLATQITIGDPNIEMNFPLEVNVAGDVGFQHGHDVAQ